MKRYRFVRFFVDTQRNIFRIPGLPDKKREQEKKEMYHIIAFQYGDKDVVQKFERWLELAPPALCVPVEYHELLREVEGAYIRGDFYPALTGACCLGERILNHLVMGLRKYHKAIPRYRKVVSKESIQNWDKAISILRDWKVIDDSVAKKFHKLLKLRTPAVHFGEVKDRSSRARSAVRLIYSVTKSLFGQSIPQFFWVSGEGYVKRCYESDPFTKEFLLPHCRKVGYRHKVETRHGKPIIVDRGSYSAEQISDNDFKELRETQRKKSAL